MNKIFKVVWNKSKNCYVVVSEFAKNNSGKKKVVVAAAVFAALAMTNTSVSFASNVVPTGASATAVAFGVGANVSGTNSVGLGTNVKANLNDVVAIGTDAKVETAGGGVAIGQNAYSKARYGNTPSVAVGKNSIANGGTAVALGTGATVNEAGNSYSQGIAIGGGALPGQGAVVVGDQAIAIGGNTKALGHSSIVIGGDDADRMTSTRAVYTDITTGKPAVATVSAAVKALTGYEIKLLDYQNATADHIGITVGTKGQSGNAGIAIGTGADSKNRIADALNGVNTSGADNTSVTNAIAIGTGAKANRDNSVALGGGSTTDKAGTKQTSYKLPSGVVAAWEGGDSTLPGDIVSFGSAGYERQLKNVAPGEVSEHSTDAINGSQLAAIANELSHKYVSIKSDDTPNKNNKGAEANNSIAIGPNASTTAAAEKSVVIGDGASATTADGVAIGSKSVASTAAGVAGYNANTGRTDTYANLTGTTLTSTLGGVAVGTTDQTRQINYVAAGTADTDAVNVAQLKSVNLAFTGDTGSGDVNLANSELAVNGDNTYIETTASGKKIKIAGKKQDITVTNGTATGTAGMADAKNVAEAINNAIDQNKYTWNLSANGEATPVTVEKGNKVDFSGDDNITVARNDKNISVALKKDLTGLNSASFNNAAGDPTVKIDGNTGINAGDKKVTNVADGVADKDAVNVSQLNKVDDKAEANKTAIARKISLGGNSGSTREKSLSTGDVKFNVKGANGLTTVASGDDVTVKLDDTTKDTIDNAADKNLSNLNPAGEQKVKDLAAWKVVANSGTAENVKGGDTVKFIDGDNIEITQAGKNFTIATKKNVTFDNITATQAITAPTVNATTGVVTPQVTGLTNRDWTPGQTTPVPGRAATEDQLKQVDNQVATNKQNIADNKTAIDKNTTAIARKISLGGNTGTTSEKSLSTADVKFNVKGDNGLTTVASGDDVTVKLDDTTKAKIDNAADQDLSNLTPAGKQQVKDLAAWKVVANNGTAEDVKGGDTVKYINGDNIVITQSGKDFTFATKPDVTFDSVTANQTVTAPKVKATTGVETPQVTGLTNKTWDPNNITSGRAATEDQLKAVDDQVKANKDNITQNTGDIADNKQKIADNKAAIDKNAGDIAANKTAINKNAGDIATNKANIDQNTAAIARKISLGSDDGDTDEKSLSTGDVKFNIKGENGITTAANGVDVTVKLDDTTKDKIDNAANRDLSNLTPTGEQQVKDLAAWNVVANNGTAEKVQGGDTVKFIDGDNVSITQNGKEFTIATKKDVTFDNVTANQKITAPEVSGLTNTTWVPGQTAPVSGRAATEDQLKAVDDQVTANKANITKNADAIKTNKDNIAANKEQIDKNTTAIGRKISLGGNSGSTDEKSLSTGDVKFNIKGQNGIVTEANGDDVTVKLDDDTANKINNAANTDLSNLTDAGKQQVKDLSAWNVVANNGTAEKVEGGNTVKFIDGDNISITQNGKDFTIATKKDVTFDTVTANQTITAPKVKATDGVETPEVTGLTNTTWNPGVTQPVSGRAATEDQLKAVDDQVAANKANITKNAGDIAANKAQIDKNTEAIGRKISLGGNTGSTDEKSLSTGDVKFNIKGENGLTTVANGEDVTVKIDDATKAKIDNAANQDLSNLTPAGKQQVKDLSAWNVTAAGGTVEKVQGGDTVKFQAGDNLEVKQDGTTFTYSLAKDVKGLNSVTVGDENGPSTKITPAGTTVKDAAGNATTVNGAGMTINPANSAASPVSLTVDGLNNGGNQIHGVAPGTADTDAVNVSQLKETKAGLQQAINNVGVETQRVGAHAAAMAALKPIQYDPLEPTQIMAGIGNYRGETAGAIGLAHYKTEDTMFNIGVTLGSSHNMINAGVTHKFGGSRDRKDAIPERYKAGPISSIYVMQDEVSHLRNQNEEYKSKLEQQQSEIDALKAAVNQLLANKA
ncbi:MAG: ESPR-type extended signal peptide-containing protein [Veillonella dispar]|uniref:ESPR-type extended signal peptide-containing protein n=1 Tax=Veillonella dispar TaxID=39778 RepID=UPI002901CB33|nr:ESPR-type extended signal peptide-containing protein [Veillonella dispar]MDU1986355.1 ESPR-type extended signal peptide-containing protein [Veillonella dispar]